MSQARHLTVVPFLVIFVLSGCMSALQAKANGELTHHLGNGVLAATWSFGSGFVLITIWLLLSPRMRAGLRELPDALRSGRLAWWAVPAGVLGGLYILCQSLAVAMVGVALFAIGLVAGQVTLSLIADRFGFGPVGRLALSGTRIASAGIAFVAVVLGVLARVGALDLAPAAAVLAFVGGSLVAVQHAIAGRTTVALGQPLTTTWLNFLFGTGVLGVITLVAIGTGVHVTAPTSGPWWMYGGGVTGVIFIITLSWGVPRYGALVMSLITIAGQLALALVLDALIPTGNVPITPLLIVSVALTFVAVALPAWRRRVSVIAPPEE